MTVPSKRPVIDACAAGSTDHTTAAASAQSVDNERRMCICVQRARSRAPDYSRGVPPHGRLPALGTASGFRLPAFGFRTCKASAPGFRTVWLQASRFAAQGFRLVYSRDDDVCSACDGEYETARVRQNAASSR